MKKRIYITVILFALFSLFAYPSKTAAKEASNLGYTVSAVLNGKQIDPETSYFYIQTLPGEEQELKVKVRSTRKEPVKLKIYTTDGFTGNEGTIEYTEDKKLLDSSLKDPISSIVTVETPSLTVENFEEKEAVFNLRPPEANYEGAKMGALVFQVDGSEDKKKMVSNKFSYRVGIITSENGDDFSDSKTLNFSDTKSTIQRGKKMILTRLQNPEPKILSELSMTAEVKEKGKKQVLKRREVDNYRMAPNSHFDFEIDWGTSDVRAGTYVITINAENSYNKWQYEKEFTITSDQAKKMNEESPFKIITPTWIKIASIVGLVLMSIFVLLQLKRRKKMEIEWKKKRKRKKRKVKAKKE